MTNHAERIELIRQAHEILDRIEAALALSWFEEEAPDSKSCEYEKAA